MRIVHGDKYSYKKNLYELSFSRPTTTTTTNAQGGETLVSCCTSKKRNQRMHFFLRDEPAMDHQHRCHADGLTLGFDSDLHSRLNGGIRTSIDVPSSFSILKVLKKIERMSCRIPASPLDKMLTPTCDHWALITTRETNIETLDILWTVSALDRPHLFLEQFPEYRRD